MLKEVENKEVEASETNSEQMGNEDSYLKREILRIGTDEFTLAFNKWLGEHPDEEAIYNSDRR